MGKLFKLRLAITMLALVTCGCIKSQELEQAAPFEEEGLDAVLCITIDQSGSFTEFFRDRAHTVFLEIANRFFTSGMGGRTRLVIGQLSGNDNVMLFEGSPGDFRKRFSSPEEFSAYLESQSDPNSSQVYVATKRTVDHVLAMSGITNETKVLTVILSDMVDSESNTAVSQHKQDEMLLSLANYQRSGGALALYYVHHDLMPQWHGLLRKAGFQPGYYIIENNLSASPQLPSFE